MASSENGQNVDEPPNKKVKGSTDLLKDIDEEFKPFRNSTIEKWNEKTRVSSGKINKNDFSAFDLPTLKQIEEILLDGERLLRRTRTKRSDYSVLGKTEPVLEKIVEVGFILKLRSLLSKGHISTFDSFSFFFTLIVSLE